MTQDHEEQKLPLKIRLNNQQETKKKILPLKSQENTQDAYINNSCSQAMNIPNNQKI
jgi:hypothetical protein